MQQLRQCYFPLRPSIIHEVIPQRSDYGENQLNYKFLVKQLIMVRFSLMDHLRLYFSTLFLPMYTSPTLIEIQRINDDAMKGLDLNCDSPRQSVFCLLR